MPGRDVKMGRKGEVDRHLLGVAWYGKEEDKGPGEMDNVGMVLIYYTRSCTHESF